MKKQLVHRVGDVENDQELNERISPFYHADKIKAPLLIGQGANDPRVKQAEADQIFNAMKVCTAAEINCMSIVAVQLVRQSGLDCFGRLRPCCRVNVVICSAVMIGMQIHLLALSLLCKQCLEHGSVCLL